MNTPDQESQLESLKELMNVCLRTTYKARESETKIESFQFNCLKLFGKDYKFSTVSNANGELCSHYPTKIVVLEYTKTPSDHHDVESLYDVSRLKELFCKARLARCRSRFAVPVILYNGKHVCRGATLSGGAELYGRSGFEFLTTGGTTDAQPPSPSTSNSEQLFDRVRGQDIRLLKELNVAVICDLMVEKKKVKFGVNVTSSEKVDKERRYADFRICAMPYPGCEFFREWRENNFVSDGVKFDWSQTYVDASLDLPRGFVVPRSIDWSKYTSWDLTTLTTNYLKLFLNYIEHGDSGILIHCISGWDRTPLFISLIRLSLWADMSIHQSLGPADILYLTIAYDWFLFGHNFPDRLAKGEDIFFFCFNFLRDMTTDDFVFKKSTRRKRKGRRTVSRTDSEFGMEGVLLDPCERGSNTSISSDCSLNSTRSSTDNAPIYFDVPYHEDEPTGQTVPPAHSNGSYTSCHHHNVPSNQNSTLSNQNTVLSNHVTVPSNPNSVSHHQSTHHSNQPAVLYMHNVTPGSHIPNNHTNYPPSNQSVVTSNQGSNNGVGGYVTANNADSLPGNGVAYSVEQQALRSHLMYTSTSPKAVPVPKATSRMLGEARSASVSGSWQMISGCGSYRGSATSYESPQCSSSSQSDHSSRGAPTAPHKHGCESSDAEEGGSGDSVRKQRLDAVRQIFLSIYTTLDLKSPSADSQGGGGGFSGLVGNFAEKLGIKQPARTTVVKS